VTAVLALPLAVDGREVRTGVGPGGMEDDSVESAHGMTRYERFRRAPTCALPGSR